MIQHKSVTACILLLFIMMTLGACTTALQPLETERVKPGINSKVHESLKEMPEPQSKVVAAVYRFRDQTGQYKPSERVASWSTAVTQGATSILIKSMEDSGWFTPIEREGVSNLLNERQIIQKTRQKNNQSGQLSPLLFAGVLLEGGIIGYDTNVITGGGGARLLGTGASGQFRKDQVTIYLRAVSTKTGRVLETVHTTKSIISQELQSGVFRYIDTNRLLETEAGFTYNEPPLMAVTEAIDEAVKLLIIRGENQGLWSARDTTAFNDYEEKYKSIKEWEEREKTNYFGLYDNDKLRSGLDVSANFLVGSHIGSYPAANEEIGASIKAEYFFSPQLSLKGNIERSSVGAQKAFSEPYTAFDLTVNGYFTPNSKLSPFVGIGAGNITYDSKPDFSSRGYFPTVSAEAGLDYRISERIGVQVGFNYRYLIRDGLDGVSKGTIHDQMWNVSTGVSYSPKFLQ